MDLTLELRNLPDFVQGRAEAEAEIAAGRLGQRAFGKLVTWWEDVARVLWDRHQIALEVVGGCTTRTNIKVRVAGYNERMNEQIAARFGADVVTETWREVGREMHRARTNR